MIFKLRHPSEDIKDYVRSFFWAEITDAAAGKDLMIASGRSYLMFYVRKTGRLFTENGVVNLENIMLAGQQYRFYQYEAPKGFTIVGVSFHPTGLHRLLGIDMNRTFSRHVSLKNILPENETCRWFNAVQDAEFFEHQKIIIENKIRELIMAAKAPRSVIQYMADDIIEKRGMVHISYYTEKLKTSQRNLESLFQKKVGISPGRFAKVNRFFYLFTDIVNNGCCNDDLIQQFGYYDRAHFHKDFKSFTNATYDDLLKMPLDFIRSYLAEYKRFHGI